jgi:thymidylate synthase ThyX
LENGEEVSVRDFLNTQRMLYNTLISEGIKREDARQILPLGLETNVVYSGNARVWREVLQKRLTQFAHWEIRGVMNGLLKEFKRRAPAVFSDIEEIEDVFIQTNDIYNIKDCSIINKKYVEKILTPVISSMIKGLGYNADNHELYAMFNTGRIYAYEDIPEHVLPFILGSESVGKEFNNIIKSDTTIKYREIV